MVLDSSSDGYILFGDRIHKTDIMIHSQAIGEALYAHWSLRPQYSGPDSSCIRK